MILSTGCERYWVWSDDTAEVNYHLQYSRIVFFFMMGVKRILYTLVTETVFQ